MPTAATITATGGTPGTDGTSGQAGQQPQSTPPASETPPSGTTSTTQGQGETPAGGTPAQPDDVAGLKSALRSERQTANTEKQRADAAEAELARLKATTQTEAEKALAEAVKAARVEVTTTFETRIRASEVRAALTAAGITGTELGLAAAAPEFGRLKVTDDGVEGLTDAVSEFRKGHPALFAKPAPPAADLAGGVRGQAGSSGYTRAQLAAMRPDQVADIIEKNGQQAVIPID